MNVVTAFLYRFLDKIIYIKHFHFFKLNSEIICQLRKALYWLKQALQVWYKTFANFLKKLGLKRLELDHCVFVSQDR